MKLDLKESSHLIRRVRSIDAFHNYYVDEAIKELQEAGCKIVSYKKVQKMKFCIFGEDVTEIRYI